MLLSSAFNFVCRFASRGNFPISSQRILFLELGGILKFVIIHEFEEFLKFVKFKFAIHGTSHITGGGQYAELVLNICRLNGSKSWNIKALIC